METDGRKTLAEALQMSSFINEYQKAFLNLQFTANWLIVPINKELKTFGLTNAQYNVLRILRGSRKDAISAVEIQSRMVYPNSNVSRILEKLSEKRLIKCEACEENRRRNNVFITDKGLNLLSKTDVIPSEIFAYMEKAISAEDALKLNDILEKLRGVSGKD